MADGDGSRDPEDLRDVRANMAWEPRVAPELAETPAPTDDELQLLREELDPGRIYTK